MSGSHRGAQVPGAAPPRDAVEFGFDQGGLVADRPARPARGQLHDPDAVAGLHRAAGLAFRAHAAGTQTALGRARYDTPAATAEWALRL